jgi:hypothetical protein
MAAAWLSWNRSNCEKPCVHYRCVKHPLDDRVRNHRQFRRPDVWFGFVPSRLLRPRWVGYGGRAPAAIYCASVSPSVRCVSRKVRRTPASVSDNVRRKGPVIARRAVHHCAPLQLKPDDRPLPKRWPGKFRQADKWNFCLRAAKVPPIRSDNGKTSTSDPQSGLQGEGGTGCHQG